MSKNEYQKEETQEEETQEEETQEESQEENQLEEEDWKAKYEEERQAREKAEKLIEKRKRRLKREKKEEPKKNYKQEEGDDELSERLARLEQTEEKRIFGHEYGLSPEESDEVFAYAKGKGIKPSEAVESPIMKSALADMRKKQKVEDNTPSSSSKTPMQKENFTSLKSNEKNDEWNKFMKQKGVIK